MEVHSADIRSSEVHSAEIHSSEVHSAEIRSRTHQVRVWVGLHDSHVTGQACVLPEGVVVLLDELAETQTLGKPFGFFPGDLVDV